MHSRPAAHVSRGAVNLGVVSLAAGAVLEWVAPLWGVLPDWLRVVASANEPMMIGGATLMIGGVLIGRRIRRTVHAAEQASVEAPPAE